MSKPIHLAPDPPRAASSSGGFDGGGDLSERLARLETEVKHLATKKDIESVKVWCLAGVLGGLLTIAGVLIVASRFLVP